MSDDVLAENESCGLLGKTHWKITRKAIHITTHNVRQSPPRERVYSLVGVNSVEAKSWRGRLFEERSAYVVIMFPIYLVFELIAQLNPSDRTHGIALRMASGNTIWLEEGFNAGTAEAIVYNIQRALAS